LGASASEMMIAAPTLPEPISIITPHCLFGVVEVRPNITDSITAPHGRCGAVIRMKWIFILV
jgi:hypothetical protein